MFACRWAKNGLMFFSLFFLFFYVLEIDALARAGGGRSMGSMGSRSFSTPRPSSPSPSRQVSPTPSSPMNQPFQQPQSGGFLRSMAGGLVGGMIGGMLFRSMGFAGGGGVGGGGIGLFEIILIGLLLYGVWWYIKKKRLAASGTGSPNYYRETQEPQQPAPYGSSSYAPAYEQQSATNDLDAGLGYLRQMDPSFDEQRFKDQCLDNFFKVQGAFANRDMSVIRMLFTDEMFGILQRDADDMKQKRRINRLENIAVRTVDMTEVWQETGKDFITVRLYANLLDYTVDEDSGQVVSGSKTEPVKFEEYWTFTRPVGNNPWQLSAINQVS
jgi:predicted lipid-binding transport protein (Tim44 family)